jgi:hypothetical protein
VYLKNLKKKELRFQNALELAQNDQNPGGSQIKSGALFFLSKPFPRPRNSVPIFKRPTGQSFNVGHWAPAQIG